MVILTGLLFLLLVFIARNNKQKPDGESFKNHLSTQNHMFHPKLRKKSNNTVQARFICFVLRRKRGFIFVQKDYKLY